MEVALPKLVVTDGESAWLLDLRPEEAVVVGRGAECDVTIDAPRASRRHVTFEPQEGAGHAVRDLGSTNGTLLNGAPLTGAVQLADGDVVEAGGCRIVYRSRP